MDVVEILKRLIEFKSITPNDDGALDFIQNELSNFDAIRVDKNGIKNLFLYKKFTDGVHLCFAGHIDVVPPGDGWESDPFSPVQKDDYIYGRGTQDMKGGLAAIISALKSIKEFNGTLSFLITSDEEGDAKYGTVEVLEYLKQNSLLPDYVILAEPTCEYRFGDTIKIGRRGSINGVLELYGIQGHAAYPEKSQNPIDLIAPILPNIAGAYLDSGDEFFYPSRFVITDIRAGMGVSNVTPAKLKMMFNVRNSTQTTKKDIVAFLENHFKGLKYEYEMKESAKPFITKKDSKVVEILRDSIKEEIGEYPKFSTSGGTSDARFFNEFNVESVEFGVINDRIHSSNERVLIDELFALESIFKRVIKSNKW